MSKDELLFLRNILLERRSSVIMRVRSLAAAWQELEERAIEIEEEAQKASITKPYDQLDFNGKIEIEQIDLALTKMSVGEYGICESCGDDISPRRLNVLPWARLCVDCARDYEKLHRTLPRTIESEVEAKIPDEYQGLTNDQIVHLIHERLQADERIDADELKLALRKGILYIDGSVSGEIDRENIVQVLTEVLGFSAIVDRMETGELILDREDYEQSPAEGPLLGDRTFYDHDDINEEMSES